MIGISPSTTIKPPACCSGGRAGTGGPQWGWSWTYDTHGNRLTQSVVKGSGRAASTPVYPATNRLQDASIDYDAAGNVTRVRMPDSAQRGLTQSHRPQGCIAAASAAARPRRLGIRDSRRTADDLSFRWISRYSVDRARFVRLPAWPSILDGCSTPANLPLRGASVSSARASSNDHWTSGLRSGHWGGRKDYEHHSRFVRSSASDPECYRRSEVRARLYRN